jgi:hypothetical protein
MLIKYYYYYFFTGLSLRLRADISKVTAHERVQYLYSYRKHIWIRCTKKKNAEERGVAKELLYLLKYVCYFFVCYLTLAILKKLSYRIEKCMSL